MTHRYSPPNLKLHSKCCCEGEWLLRRVYIIDSNFFLIKLFLLHLSKIRVLFLFNKFLIMIKANAFRQTIRCQNFISSRKSIKRKKKFQSLDKWWIGGKCSLSQQEILHSLISLSFLFNESSDDERRHRQREIVKRNRGHCRWRWKKRMSRRARKLPPWPV